LAVQQKDHICSRFGGTSVVKDKAVAVLIEYIPTLYNPDALTENRIIECDSKSSKAPY